ncbi:MAG TPA: hypothetical protein VH593_34360 [Ktedonobacteraceae bacterium]
MNFGSLALKGLVVLAILLVLSLTSAITFTLTSIGSSTALTSVLFTIIAILVLAIIGNLLGRGIRSVQKKPLEALLLTFVGSFVMGAALALFSILNQPYTPRINLTWLGTSWYAPLLTMLLVGSPLMLVFLAPE